MKTAWSDPVQRLATTAGWHVRQLLTRPGEELSLLHRTAAFWIRLSISCARKLRRDRASQVAAALTYQTLFSLVPTVVLALLLFSSVQGLDGASERARSSVIDFVLPDSLVGATAAGEEVSGTGSEEFDDAREILRVRIDELLQRLEEVNLAGIGLIGLAAFLYGATSLMSTIEGSFNSIYQAEETRPLTIRLPLYFSVVVLSPLALVAAQIAQDKIMGILGADGRSGPFSSLVGALAPFVTSWLVIFLLFRLLPNTRVSFRSAAVGSFLSAAGWLLFKGLFGFYLSHTVLTSLYGAIALVPLFLLWIYGSWLVVLFGLEVASSLQFLTLGITNLRAPIHGDPRWFVPIMYHVARAFAEGQAISVGDLCGKCQLSPAFLRPFLRILEDRELVRRSPSPEGERMVLLARPADTIPVRDLLTLEPLPNQEDEDASRLLAWLRAKEAKWLETATLADLLDSQAEPEPA